MTALEMIKREFKAGQIDLEAVVELIEGGASAHSEQSQLAVASLIRELYEHVGCVNQDVSWGLGIQWSRIFLQAAVRDQTLTEALEGYEYPNGLPNLTKDVTDRWELEEDSLLRHTEYPDEFVRIAWALPGAEGVFRFTKSMVMLPSGRILKFD